MTLNYGTAYYGLGSDAVKFEIALRTLAEGNSLRATARIVEADKDPIGAWLDRAARQCRAVILSLWRDLPARECPLDELWSFIHTKQDQTGKLARRQRLRRDGWRRLGVVGVCPSLALGIGVCHRQTRSNQRGPTAQAGRVGDR
ncbi:MAG: hypothetical protein IPL99_28970 [Candidatus Competibacteraceae bacterium]|nr:hypothetical protein [Candidatus Competibacteraceae bacterium]